MTVPWRPHLFSLLITHARLFLLTLSVAIALPLMMSCGSGGNRSVPSPDSAYPGLSAESRQLQSEAQDKGGEGQSEPIVERILTYSADITILMNPDKHEQALNDLAEYAQKNGGYFTSRSRSRIILKVPSMAFRQSISHVKSFGEVENESIYVKDITNTYYDTQLRLQNKLKLVERLKELLARAEKVDEAMKLEVEISRVTGQIERLKAQMRRLNSLKDFSTITVELKEPTIYGPVGFVFYWSFKVIRYMFVIQ